MGELESAVRGDKVNSIFSCNVHLAPDGFVSVVV